MNTLNPQTHSKEINQLGKLISTSFLSLLLITGGNFFLQSHAYAQKNSDSKNQSSPDNTKLNARDAKGKTLTPGDQSNNKRDLNLTQRIRKAVTQDSSLSTNAHNIKIITVNGTVTLRGPVTSQAEKDNIADKAQIIAGKNNIINQLEIILK